jgi:hypothetical protein
VAVEDEGLVTGRFIASTSNESGLRTSHPIGGCWRRIGYEFKNYETRYPLEDLRYIPFCKLRWRVGTGPAAMESCDDDGSESCRFRKRVTGNFVGFFHRSVGTAVVVYGLILIVLYLCSVRLSNSQAAQAPLVPT